MVLDRSPLLPEISMRKALDITRTPGGLGKYGHKCMEADSRDFHVTLDSMVTAYSWTGDKPLRDCGYHSHSLGLHFSSIKWVNNSVVSKIQCT